MHSEYKITNIRRKYKQFRNPRSSQLYALPLKVRFINLT